MELSSSGLVIIPALPSLFAAFQVILGFQMLSIVIWEAAATGTGFALGYRGEQSRKGRRENNGN